MDKLKNIFSPGHEKDDEVLYGEGGNTGRRTGEGSHFGANPSGAQDTTTGTLGSGTTSGVTPTNQSATNTSSNAPGNIASTQLMSSNKNLDDGASAASIKSGIPGNTQSKSGLTGASGNTHSSSLNDPLRNEPSSGFADDRTQAGTGSGLGAGGATRHHDQRGGEGVGSAAIGQTSTDRSFPLRGGHNSGRDDTAGLGSGNTGLGSTADQRAPTTSDNREHLGRDAAIGGLGAGGATAAANHGIDSDRSNLTGHGSGVSSIGAGSAQPSTTGSGVGSGLGSGSTRGNASDNSNPYANPNIDPRVDGGSAAGRGTGPTSTGNTHDHHLGRDAALGGAGAAGLYEADKHHRDNQRDTPSSGIGNDSSNIGTAHTTGLGSNPRSDPSNIGTATTTGPSGTGNDRHYGRDAALGGAGAAGLYEADKHHRDHERDGLSSTTGGDPSRVGNIMGPSSTTTTGGTGLSGTSQSGSGYPTGTSQTGSDYPSSTGQTSRGEHHLGREAGIAGAGVGASGLGAHSTGGGNSEGGILEFLHKGDNTATTSAPLSGHHHGRDEGLGGAGIGAAGLGAYEANKHHDRDTPSNTSGYPSSVSNTAQGTSGYPSTTSGTTPGTSHGDHQHHGRDAGLAGAGLGAAGLGAHEVNKHHDRDTPSSLSGYPSTGSNTARDTSGYPSTTSDTAQGTSGYPSATSGTTRDEDRHTGRDAALAGTAGVGAGALAGHEHHQHDRHQPTSGGMTGADRVPERTDDRHTGRDAALAGTAGAGAYAEHEHHQHDKQDKTLAKEEKHHEKAIAKEEKHREKEIRKEEKAEEKEEGKKHGGLFGLLHRHKDKDAEHDVKHTENYDDHRGAKTAAGVGAGTGVGAAAYEAEKHHDHDHDHEGRNRLHKDPPAGYAGDNSTPAYTDRPVQQDSLTSGRGTTAGGLAHGDTTYGDKPTTGYASQVTGGTGTTALAEGEPLADGSHLTGAGNKLDPAVADRGDTLQQGTGATGTHGNTFGSGDDTRTGLGSSTGTGAGTGLSTGAGGHHGLEGSGGRGGSVVIEPHTGLPMDLSKGSGGYGTDDTPVRHSHGGNTGI